MQKYEKVYKKMDIVIYPLGEKDYLNPYLNQHQCLLLANRRAAVMTSLK